MKAKMKAVLQFNDDRGGGAAADVNNFLRNDETAKKESINTVKGAFLCTSHVPLPGK